MAAMMLIGLMAGLVSCSKEKEDAIMYDDKTENQIFNEADFPSLIGSFRGVWSVDNVSADTVDVDVSITNYGRTCYVSFLGFPFKAIAERVLPETKVVKVTHDMIIGAPLPSDEAMYLQNLIDHGDNYNCIQTVMAVDYRMVGISHNTAYLELSPGRDFSYRYLPFVVTSDKGEMYPVTAYIIPSKSTAYLDTNGETFSCLLVVSQIETKVDGEMKLKKFDPELKVRYTSIKRIERATVGN